MNTYIVIRDINHWVIDENLPQARKRFKRLTGKFPSSKANIIAFTGELEELERLTVNDLGDIIYSLKLTKAIIQ